MFISSEVTYTHPSLSMARPMMYIFLLFTAFWNLRANGYLYGQVLRFRKKNIFVINALISQVNTMHLCQ
jgi:hypothetical protein